jgi:MFS family permease
VNDRLKAGAGAPRLLAWISAESFFIVGVVVTIAFAILSADIAGELGIGESQLGALSGTFFVTYAVGQLVLGAMLGSYSPRLLLGSMAALSAIGCLVFAASTSMPLALISRMLLGIGLSISFVGVVHVIGRDFPQRFSFMLALSQSLANLAGAAVALSASFTAILTAYRAPYTIAGVIFVPIAIALVLVAGGRTAASPARPEPAVPIGTVLAACVRSLQFWMGLVYYSCLFGTMLAYADLWNIQFQTSYFAHSIQESALLNAAIPIGVTVGSLAVGIWTQMRGDFVLPARVFGLLGVAAFALMLVLVLDMPLAIAANFLVGFALAGSILGLAAVQKHLPEFAQATATAIIASGAFILGGVIQPLVGMLVEVPVHSAAVFSRVLLNTPVIGGEVISNADFATYQKGLSLLIGYVFVGFLASLLFKPQNRKENP